MVIDVQWIIFCVAMLGTAVLSNSLRFLFLKQMKQVPQAAPESELHPAELAYLFRPDDSSHCLIVLIVDLLQKGLKSPALLADELAESQYELQIWNSLKSYIKGWTMQQAESVLPELGTRNPVRIATGFWRLRKWLSGGFSSIFSDLKKDPRGLRRFFSPA